MNQHDQSDDAYSDRYLGAVELTNPVQEYCLRSRNRCRSSLLCVLAIAMASAFSFAEDASSEVAQLAKAVNQAHAAWTAGYSDTSYTYQYMEYFKGEQIVNRLFELNGFGMDKFQGAETFGYKRCCRMVQAGASFSYYVTQAHDFDGKGAVYQNSLWKSDGQNLRVLQYPIGKPVSQLLALGPQTPSGDYTEELAKSRAKGPPDSKDMPWSILKNALGFSTEKSPNEVFISDEMAKTIANARLVPAVNGRPNVLKIDDGTSARGIHINTATHLPESVDIVERDGALNVTIEITYFQPEEINVSAPFPKKIVWKGFIVEGGRKIQFMERACEVSAVKFGAKAPLGEFDNDSLKAPVETLNENTRK